MSIRTDILNNAIKIVEGSRDTRYGEPEDSFSMIADLWSAYLDTPISSKDVCMCMVLLKIARTKGNVGHMDNYIDIAGYAACAGGIDEKESTE